MVTGALFPTHRLTSRAAMAVRHLSSHACGAESSRREDIRFDRGGDRIGVGACGAPDISYGGGQQDPDDRPGTADGPAYLPPRHRDHRGTAGKTGDASWRVHVFV